MPSISSVAEGPGTGTRYGFLDWMKIGVPLIAILFMGAFMLGFFRLLAEEFSIDQILKGEDG